MVMDVICRKGDLFVLSWARVLRVRLGSMSLELIMCGGGVHSISLMTISDTKVLRSLVNNISLIRLLGVYLVVMEWL